MTDDAATNTDETDAPADAPKSASSGTKPVPPSAPVKTGGDDEDDISLKELVTFLYEGANQVRPKGSGGSDLMLDMANPDVVSQTLNYLVLHARATEGALRKMAEMIDQLRSSS